MKHKHIFYQKEEEIIVNSLLSFALFNVIAIEVNLYFFNHVLQNFKRREGRKVQHLNSFCQMLLLHCFTRFLQFCDKRQSLSMREEFHVPNRTLNLVQSRIFYFLISLNVSLLVGRVVKNVHAKIILPISFHLLHHVIRRNVVF